MRCGNMILTVVWALAVFLNAEDVRAFGKAGDVGNEEMCSNLPESKLSFTCSRETSSCNPANPMNSFTCIPGCQGKCLQITSYVCRIKAYTNMTHFQWEEFQKLAPEEPSICITESKDPPNSFSTSSCDEAHDLQFLRVLATEKTEKHETCSYNIFAKTNEGPGEIFNKTVNLMDDFCAELIVDIRVGGFEFIPQPQSQNFPTQPAYWLYLCIFAGILCLLSATTLKVFLWKRKHKDQRFPRPIRYGFRDPVGTFVGRSSTLNELETAVKTGGKTLADNTIAVVGGGGVGKTETVRKFLSDYSKNVSMGELGIVWLEASSDISLNTEMIMLAKDLDIQVTDFEKNLEGYVDKIYGKVCKFKTIVVFGNWEIFSRSTTNTQLPLSDRLNGVNRYLPKTTHGLLHVPTIIITTVFQTGWWDPGVKTIELGPFEIQECQQLLQSELKHVPDLEERLQELAEFCSHLPLALRHAIAVINRKSNCEDGYSIAKFLEETRHSKLMISQEEPVQGFSTHLFSMWNTFFQNLHSDYANKETVIQLLKVIGVLSPDRIPIDLVRRLLNEPVSKYASRLNGEQNGPLNLLIALSLVNINKDGTLRVNRVLQTYCYDYAIFNSRDPALLRFFNDSTETFLSIASQLDAPYEKHAVILQNLSEFLKAVKPAMCLENVVRLYLISGQIFQEYHFPTALEIASTLSSMYQEQRQEGDPRSPIDASVRNFIDSIENKVKGSSGSYETFEMLSRLPASTLDMLQKEEKHYSEMRNFKFKMGIIYSLRGKYEDALQIFEAIYQEQVNRLGWQDPRTLATLRNVAKVYEGQERYEDAHQILERIYENLKLVGEEHPDAMKTKREVASIYKRQGRYEHALKILEEVHSIQCSLLGEDHPNSIRTYQDIASIYSNQGKYEEALKICHLVYQQQCGLFGEEHPSSLATLYDIASSYKLQGKYDSALRRFSTLYDRACRVLGLGSTLTLAIKYHIASIQEVLGHYEDDMIPLPNTRKVVFEHERKRLMDDNYLEPKSNPSVGVFRMSNITHSGVLNCKFPFSRSLCTPANASKKSVGPTMDDVMLI